MGDDAITALHQFGSGGLRPDLVVLLEVHEERLAARLAERDGETSDAIGGRGAEYHRKVAASFRRLAEADPDGFVVIDGNGPAEAVHAEVLKALAGFLDKQ